MKRSLIHCIQQCHRTRHQKTANLLSNNRRTAHHYQTRTIGTSNATHHKHAHQSILHDIHPQHLYQIINHVDQYQHFLPYCNESKILQQSPCGTMYDAMLRVGLPGLSNYHLMEEKYVSRVKMIPPPDAAAAADADFYDGNAPLMWTVEAKSIQSQLFESLKSRWQLTFANTQDEIIFDHDGNVGMKKKLACSVNFEVEMEVSNPLISLTLDQVLKDVARKQVEAFEKRCNEIPFEKQ